MAVMVAANFTATYSVANLSFCKQNLEKSQICQETKLAGVTHCCAVKAAPFLKKQNCLNIPTTVLK